MFSQDLQKWLRSGNMGTSSNSIVEIIEGLPVGMLTGVFGQDHPHDPGDFARCVNLLRSVPEYRDKLTAMKRVSNTWAALVDHWDELESLYDEELPTGKCPELYTRMQKLINQSGGGF